MNRWALVLLVVLVAIVNSGCSGIVASTNSLAPVAPSIGTEPTSQTVTAGQPASFSVTATGTAPLTYQWKKNNVAISGATSSAYTTAATISSDNGAQFTVVVSNAAGSATSSAAMLTVSAAAVAPSITMQPLSQTVTAGQPASFSVTAAGTAPLSYQWNKNGAAISGATSSTYATAATTSSDNGAQFTVDVSNTAGSVTSAGATLTVNAASSPLQVTITQLPGGAMASSYNAALSASGGSSPYTWSLLSGALPNGLSVNVGGTISGTPILTGSFSFTVQVQDAKGATASRPSLTITLLNGQGNALDGFFCSGSHHLRFIGNSVSNTGGSGVSTVHCDYITADHNLVSHNGYIPSNASNVSWWSWTSGISLNSSQWFDTYSGLHNIISNNTVVGEFDNTSNHTDGNGIILDLGGNTPPTLILNNLLYGNGARCIQPNYVQNFYIINNTCYKNDLDPSEPNFPSFGTNGASNGYIVNNIAYAWNSRYHAYGEYNGSSNIFFYTNLLYGASYNFSYSDPSQFIQADPLFVSAPSLTQGGYSSAMPASQLGTALTLLPLSPAYSRGIDPSTLSGMASAIVSDLKKYIYTDINGKARPQVGSVDLGAYQH